MKYSESNKPIVCMQTNSTCYKGTSKMLIKGILWHSTGANNPWIKRYVQPSDNASDREKMLKLIGVNAYKNDWNHIYHKAGLIAWIGKLADGTVSTVQTMPWDFRPWGCGSGSRGTCNNGWIQFEICEDALNDRNYFNKVYQEACELTAYLCKKYNLNPNGYTTYNGIKVPVIICHKDSYTYGLGGNHGDIYHWFSKYGKDMEDVRNDVAALMKSNNTSSTAVSKDYSSAVKTLVTKGVINSPDYWLAQENSIKYLNTLVIKLAEMSQSGIVGSIKNVKDAINHLVDCGVINSPEYWVANYSKVKSLDTLLIKSANHICKNISPYIVRTSGDLIVYKTSSVSCGTNGKIAKGAYTVVEEVVDKNSIKWGLLKSYQKTRNGWIKLNEVKKIT